MCGVFGFVSTSGEGPSIDRLCKVARVTERRGRHAFGLAWVDGRGRLKCYKQTGRISEHLGILRNLAADARLLIGHCRYATAGDYNNNLNNHPHPVDGGWLVHNGTIADHQSIADQYGIKLVTECDSEVLGGLIEHFDGSLLERSCKAVQVAGDRPLAMLNVFRNPQRLIAVRSGNPLHIGEAGRGYYLASLREGLPRDAFLVEDNSALSFSYRKGEIEVKHAQLATVDAYELF